MDHRHGQERIENLTHDSYDTLVTVTCGRFKPRSPIERREEERVEPKRSPKPRPASALSPGSDRRNVEALPLSFKISRLWFVGSQ